jgi:hypothetical protein
MHMSAENFFSVAKMDNGQYWLLSRHWYNAKPGILAKCGTFSGLRKALRRVANRYFECHSGLDWLLNRDLTRSDMAKLDAYLDGHPVCWTHSDLDLRIAGRRCQCARESEILSRRWRVTEYGNGTSRIVGDRLTYAEALECANGYAVSQPGDISFYQQATAFRRFPGPGDEHNCFADDTVYELTRRRRDLRRAMSSVK